MSTSPEAVASRSERIRKLLVQRGWLTDEQLARVDAEHKKGHRGVGRIAIELGFITDAHVQALNFGLDFVPLSEYPIDVSAAALLPTGAARRYVAVPIAFEGQKLLVALGDPQNVIARDDIRSLTGRETKFVVAAKDEILEILTRLQQFDRSAYELLEQAAEDEEEPELEMAREEDAPVVKAIDDILAQAVQQRASDVHIEPQEYDVRIRYRIDGVLHETSTVPKKIQNAMVSRLKIMAEMDIAERRVPQDGRITIKPRGGDSVDLRCATLPSVWGEKVVLRILDRAGSVMRLEDLGFLPDALKRYEGAYKKPYGMILVTGPTGSGKSTTLYATLNILNDPQKNLITVEDPVEYRLAGLTQMQMNPKAGLHFHTALRSILRADPDVVMIGEIRDRETATIAIEAALTGHLVLSTLHTNDAPSAITRLVEMGVEPFLVASALDCVMGQRLARKLCDRCKTGYHPSADALIESGFPWHEGEPIPELYRPEGCRACAGTGYRGRFSVVEVMPFSEDLERMTAEKRSSEDMKRVAIQQGMQTLREDGLEKVRLGWTSLEEVFRAV